MNVLVVGCGSIGKRHINNLIRLDDIHTIYVYTKAIHCQKDFNDNSKIKFIDSSTHSLNPPIPPLVKGGEGGFSDKPDFAIIANETHKHIDTAISLAESGINLFIEKPLSHSLKKMDVLIKIVKEKDLKVFVAYNLRFLKAMGFIKEQISKRTIGDLYFARIEVGQYLPQWRPDSDYRDSYSASKIKGGGAALDLSHEIDYMRYLFGDPSNWKVIKAKVSDLEIDSDDIFEGIYLYDNNFICSIHMDYLQIEKKRQIRIVGSAGTIICDFVKNEITVNGNNKSSVINDKNMFDINKTYTDEIMHFIESIKRDVEPAITLEDGLKVLRLLEDKNV